MRIIHIGIYILILIEVIEVRNGLNLMVTGKLMKAVQNYHSIYREVTKVILVNYLLANINLIMNFNCIYLDHFSHHCFYMLFRKIWEETY